VISRTMSSACFSKSASVSSLSGFTSSVMAAIVPPRRRAAGLTHGLLICITHTYGRDSTRPAAAQEGQRRAADPGHAGGPAPARLRHRPPDRAALEGHRAFPRGVALSAAVPARPEGL